MRDSRLDAGLNWRLAKKPDGQKCDECDDAIPPMGCYVATDYSGDVCADCIEDWREPGRVFSREERYA